MKYVLMFCDTPELYGEVDEVAAKAVHEEIWAWFGEHDAAGRIADMGAHLQPVTTATTIKSGDGAPVVARTWPPLKFPGVSVEVRPIVDYSGDM